MSKIPEVSFWNGNHPLTQVAKDLRMLIPDEGAVPEAHKNPALERLRIALNCYYDLYNNGLINRARSFARVFRCRASSFKVYCFRNKRFVYGEGLYELAETRLAEIVRAAALEQMPFRDLP